MNSFYSPTHTRHQKSFFVTNSFALSLLLLLVPAAIAQTSPTDKLKAQIATEMNQINTEEQNHAANSTLGLLWSKVASDYQDLSQFQDAEKAYTKSLQYLSRSPEAFSGYAIALDNLGALYLLLGRDAEAEHLRKTALKVRQEHGDTVGVAISYGYLAEVYLGQHKYKEAEKYASLSYQTAASLPVPNRAFEIAPLITRVFARCQSGKAAQGLQDAQLVASLAEKDVPADSLSAGTAIFTLGFAEWKAGSPEHGQERMARGLDILSKKMADQNPYLIGARSQYQKCLKDAHKDREAQELADRLAELKRSQSKPDCANCTVNVYGISSSLR